MNNNTITINMDFISGNEISYEEGLVAAEKGQSFETNSTAFFSNCYDCEVIVKRLNGDYISKKELLENNPNEYTEKEIRPAHNLEKMLIANAYTYKRGVTMNQHLKIIDPEGIMVTKKAILKTFSETINQKSFLKRVFIAEAMNLIDQDREELSQHEVISLITIYFVYFNEKYNLDSLVDILNSRSHHCEVKSKRSTEELIYELIKSTIDNEVRFKILCQLISKIKG